MTQKQKIEKQVNIDSYDINFCGNIAKANIISLKQMELRKSKRIYAAGSSDDYINVR